MVGHAEGQVIYCGSYGEQIIVFQTKDNLVKFMHH